MSELLLPPEKHSLLWESLRFCLFVQQRRVRGTGLPWGVSESAYRALEQAVRAGDYGRYRLFCSLH